MAKTKLFIWLFLILFTVSNAQETIDLNLKFREKLLPFGLTKKVPLERPIVGLVLSGGGARAISHIGVLKAVEELNIPIDYIVGTSMGSVIGGLYSVGYNVREIDSIMCSVDWNNLFSSNSLSRKNLFVDQKITEDKAILAFRFDGLKLVPPKSINSGYKISNLLTLLTLNAPINNFRTFDELLYNYRAISTDLVTGEKIVLKDGSLSQAMRSSSSVSFLLPPIKKGSQYLVDGGLVDNLPIKTAKENNVDFIIASDATSKLRTEKELNFPWEIADQLVSIPTQILKEEGKKYADIIIEQKLAGKKNSDFTNLEKIIKEGYQNALKKIGNSNSEIEKRFIRNLSADNRIYRKLNIPEKPNFMERDIYKKFLLQDSITNSQIKYELYSYFALGNYKNISASISNDSTKMLYVKFSKNDLIASVKSVGIFSINKNYVDSIFNHLVNKPYNTSTLLEAILNVIKSYRKKGLSLATVNNVIFDKYTGLLTIEFSEGVIGNLIVEGNKNTNTNVISREFSTKTGDLLFYKNIKQGLNNLSSTDLFTDIDFSFEKKNSLQRMKIKLEEKLPVVLRIGLRIDNEYYSQVAVDLRNENILGTATELGANISGGIRNFSFILEHKANRIFNTYLTYKVQGYYKFNDINTYEDDEISNERVLSRTKNGEYRQYFYGASIGIGTHLKKLGTLTAEGKYQIDRIDELLTFPKEKTYKEKISSIKIKLQVDTQNKYPFPTKGSFLNTYYETAQKVLGGDVSFAKYWLNYRSYFSLSNQVVFIPSIVLGFADKTLPLSEHFSFGGQKNFLGYRDYEYRGRQIFIASMEYRYKLPFKIYFDTYLKFKYNLGSVWENQEQIKFKHLKHGIGLTISLDTPIGPADFSIGKSFIFKNTLPKNIISSTKPYFYFTIGYYY